MPFALSTNNVCANVVRIACTSVMWLIMPCTSTSITSSASEISFSARATAGRSIDDMPRMSVPTNTTHSSPAVVLCTPPAVSPESPSRPWP